MHIDLHANATTMPKQREYIQESDKPVKDLAEELGVSETTVRRWFAARPHEAIALVGIPV